jgi:hypothetical protein
MRIDALMGYHTGRATKAQTTTVHHHPRHAPMITIAKAKGSLTQKDRNGETEGAGLDISRM